MALTRTWPIYTDTLLAKSGSTPLGGGNDEHLPIGMAGSYYCKAALKFSLDWTGVTKVISARLYLKTTTKVHATSWGSTPTLYVERQTTGNWSENDGRSSYDSPAGSGWSTAASDFDSANVQPTGVDRVSWTPGNNESTWYSVDITAMVNSWAPASVLRSTGTPGGAAPNYGMLVRPTANATSETIEFYSRKSGSDPYIVLTYDSNTAPNAPTTPTPNPGWIQGQSVACSFLYDDPQGDASSAYQLQVATDSGFASIVYDSGVVALVQADSTLINHTIPGPLTRGVTYYWRAQTRDAAGLISAWSATWYFVVNSLPVATLTEPSATGRLAKLQYDAGSGWAAPRLVVAWSYSDAQGQGQTQYEIDVRADSGGSPGTIIVNTVVAGAATSHVVTQTITENTRYHIRVRSYDGLEWGNWSGYFIVRARWGYTVHTKDVRIASAPPTSWQVTVINAPVDIATQGITIEYNSADDAAGTNLGTTWQPSLATVTKRNFVRYRVWFMAWGASPAPLPALLDLTIRTSGLTVQPERWLPNPISGAGGSIEFSDRVFGTQSLRIDGPGPRRVYQQVPVEPDTNYVLQARIKSYGNSGAKVFLSDSAAGASLPTYETAPATGDLPWTQRISPVWNSGSRTSIFVACYVSGAAGTVGLFDGLKLERGRVTSPWTPGLVGVGVAIDSGGVQIDASNASGAIFRLRASAGGIRDIVELGVHGLEFGGDVEVWSGGAGLLDIGSESAAVGSTLGVHGGSSGNEGGQVDLYGAAANADWSWDNLAGSLRWFTGGLVKMTLTPAVHDIAVPLTLQSLPATTPVKSTAEGGVVSAKGTAGHGPAMDDHQHGLNLEGFNASITPVANTMTSTTVTGLFTKTGTQACVVTPVTTSNNVTFCSVSGVTPTSAIVWINRTNTTATGLYCLHYGY